MVSHWTLFVAREVGRRRGLYEYRLRNSSLRLALRHGTGDAATLTEVFHLRYYEPPAEIAQAIGDPRLIIDLGANVGFFGAFASERWPNAQIVAYEPDPSNAAVHARTVAANKLADRWSLPATPMCGLSRALRRCHTWPHTARLSCPPRSP
jgi:hypothetical protein